MGDIDLDNMDVGPAELSGEELYHESSDSVPPPAQHESSALAWVSEHRPRPRPDRRPSVAEEPPPGEDPPDGGGENLATIPEGASGFSPQIRGMAVRRVPQWRINQPRLRPLGLPDRLGLRFYFGGLYRFKQGEAEQAEAGAEAQASEAEPEMSGGEEEVILGSMYFTRGFWALFLHTRKRICV